MKEIDLGPGKVGNGEPIFIIAEIGVNHNGSLDTAKKLIDAAVEAGADAVKFQTFKADDMVTDYAEKAEYQKKETTDNQLRMLKNLELSEDDHFVLKKYCDDKGIIFCSTPHSSKRDVDLLEKIGVPFYKIGSGDLTNLPIIDYIAKKRKPVIISEGMGNQEEILDAHKTIKEAGNENFVFLKCTTSYPCPDESANVRGMETLQQLLDCLVGYSDHTTGYTAAALATSLGANVIEKHFTLDRKMRGPDHISSLEPEELKKYIDVIRYIDENEITLNNVYRELEEEFDIKPDNEESVVLGSGELDPSLEELRISKAARKSIVAKKNLKKGVVLKEEYLASKRPGSGLSPKFMFGSYNKIIGKRLVKDVKRDEQISFDHVE